MHWFLLVQFVPWQTYPSTKLLRTSEDVSRHSVLGCLGSGVTGVNKLSKTINSKPAISLHKSSTGPLFVKEPFQGWHVSSTVFVRRLQSTQPSLTPRESKGEIHKGSQTFEGQNFALKSEPKCALPLSIEALSLAS